MRVHETSAPTRAVATLRPLGLVVLAGVLAVLVVASLLLGSRTIGVDTVWAALWQYDPASDDQLALATVRVPRVLVALLVGAAMGGAGALMQGLTRNALADPGILGVNAGAALFVVVAITWLGIGGLLGLVWFAFAGAAVTSVLVYLLGTGGRGGGGPVALTLAGAAVTVLLSAMTAIVLLTDRTTNQAFRFWAVGSVAGRELDVVVQIVPFLLAGSVVALACGRLLNAISLGDDVARSIGTRPGVVRSLTGLSVVMLCGASTAIAGPISFVGFLVPHVARVVTGPDHRWIVPYSMLLGAALLLVADLVGRVAAAPAEVSAGLVVVLVGGPVFVVLARRRGLVEL